MSYGYFMWAPRKTAGARRADAARQIRDAAKRGKPMSPVTIAGRTIAHTFWGKAWCDNLERYRDFAYRLDRGRSYVRSGSVIDLKIGPGKIAAKVSGSSLYDVAIDIDAVKADAWRAIRRDCSGSIGSRVDLLSGKLSDAVMTRLCAERTGLFPAPQAIRFTCSCPDYAIMCKHVAATMYGVGARLDHAPELLFALRRASVDDLVTAALSELPANRPRSARVLAADGLAAMFGIELAESATTPSTSPNDRGAGKRGSLNQPASPMRATASRTRSAYSSTPPPVQAPSAGRAKSARKTTTTARPRTRARTRTRAQRPKASRR